VTRIRTAKQKPTTARKPRKVEATATPDTPSTETPAATKRSGVIGYIADTNPYLDPDPPACDACWAVRQCTKGRVRLCRWCAGEPSDNVETQVHSKRTSTSVDDG
jgi:hypothetical protein